MNTISIGLPHVPCNRARASAGRYFLLRVDTPAGVRCASSDEPASGSLPLIEWRELTAEEAWMVQPLPDLLAELDAIAAARRAAEGGAR